jgi:hypothetical protein
LAIDKFQLEFLNSDEKLDLNALKHFLENEDALTEVNDLINFFEKLNTDQIENLESYYFVIWKFLNKSGKVSKALEFANKYLNHLFLYKKIPAIKIFIADLKTANFPKKKIERYEIKLALTLGDKSYENTPVFDELYDWHDDHWKTHKESLKRGIIASNVWNSDLVKMIYEYTLKYYFDQEVMEKYKEYLLENKKYSKDFINYLKQKEINIFHKKTESKEVSLLTLDYDQLAYSVVTGKKQNHEEEARVIMSLENMPYEELSQKGSEMLVAFRMLGMNEVVQFLSDRLLTFDLTKKEKLSIAYIKCEAMSEANDFYGLIKFVEEVIREMEVNQDELKAFYYLCFEVALIQKKKIKAKAYAEKIKAIDKKYRDVNKRLLEIEKN